VGIAVVRNPPPAISPRKNPSIVGVCLFFIIFSGGLRQGCQTAYFQTRNPDLGKFWRLLQWKMWIYVINGHLDYFKAIWYILWTLVYFMVIWYIFLALVNCTKKNLATLVCAQEFKTPKLF
jgi:hypothetical protein